MSEKNKDTLKNIPKYGWGEDTVTWQLETEALSELQDKQKQPQKSKEELQKEINYGKRKNYWN